MNRKNQRLTTLLLCLVGACWSTATAADEILLCVDGVAGESTVADPARCIDLQSWRWAGDRPASSQTGSTRRRGVPVVEPLVVFKELDKSSPPLLLGFFQAKSYQNVELLVLACPTGCGGKPIRILSIRMENVTLTQFDMGSTRGTRPTESVGLQFEQFEYCYTETEDDGSAGNETCISYDLESGV